MGKIVALDSAVYKDQYVPKEINIKARYMKNPDSYIIVEDTTNQKPAGYICFFPCAEELHKDIWVRNLFRDDDITPDEIAEYSSERNHLFIFSVVISETYRGTKVVKLLTNEFIKKIRKLQTAGTPITDIAAIAVSLDGIKYLENLNFKRVYSYSTHEFRYICKGSDIKFTKTQ